MSGEPGLHLDARQRAMLDEMGIKVWWPAQRRSPAVEAAEAVSPATDAAAAPVPAARPPSPAVPRAPAAAPARAATATARAFDSPSSASRPPRSVPDVSFDAPVRLYTLLDEDGIAPPPHGGWLVVADLPPEARGRQDEPFAGEAGRLLDNMLRALQLHDGRTPVHLMCTHRGAAPPADTAGTDFAALATALAPRIVLAMGPLAAQKLLQSAEPLGRLRGHAAPLRIAPGGALDGVPVVVTYPPAYLLRNPADKARAWADLCLAADQFAARPSPWNSA